jgi:type I restriction enzyme S subunit
MKYRAYPEYKESGVELLGKVPSDWVILPLKFLIKSQKGAVKAGPFGSHLKGSDLEGTDVKVMTQKNVIEKEQVQRWVHITTRGTIGRTIVYDRDVTSILHPCLIRIQINKKVHLILLLY